MNDKNTISESLRAMKQLMKDIDKDGLKEITDYINTLAVKDCDKVATIPVETTASDICHGVSVSDSKGCQNCTFHDHKNTGCNHSNWDRCVIRNKDGVAIGYRYHRFH